MPSSNYLKKQNSRSNRSWDRLTPPHAVFRIGPSRVKTRLPLNSLNAPVSHQKRARQRATNAIELKRKRSKINEDGRYPPAHNGLVARSSAARTNNEISCCSEPCVRSRWTLVPSNGEVPSSSERPRASPKPRGASFLSVRRGTQSYDEFIAAIPLRLRLSMMLGMINTFDIGWADQIFGPASSNARVAARANEEMAELLRALTADIEPDDADHPTIHGLRGTGIRRAPSKPTRSTRSPTTSACPGRTSSTTCASRIRCRSRSKCKSGFGWSRRRTRPRTLGRLYHRCQTPDLENSLAILENFRKKCCQISHFGGEWCNGSTTDSDSVCLGSNPGSPATSGSHRKPLKD